MQFRRINFFVVEEALCRDKFNNELYVYSQEIPEQPGKQENGQSGKPLTDLFW